MDNESNSGVASTRSTKRLEVRLPARLAEGRLKSTGVITDISPGGAQLLTYGFAAAAGERIELTFRLDEYAEPATVLAEVVWAREGMENGVRQNRFGIRWPADSGFDGRLVYLLRQAAKESTDTVDSKARPL